MQKILEIKVEVRTGECKTCAWRNIIRKRIEDNPDYVPYGGRKKCADNKNYKNCSGYMPED